MLEQPQSEFVRHIMKGATEAEIAESARRWFAFLKIIGRIADRELTDRDSDESEGHGRVDS